MHVTNEEAAEKSADKLDWKRQQPTPAEAKLEALKKAHAIGALSDDLYQVLIRSPGCGSREHSYVLAVHTPHVALCGARTE